MDDRVKVANQEHGENWTLWHGDCVQVARGLPDNSVHYIIYSPPFESLYTFSDDLRDIIGF
jgi:DNA modification methylase